MDITYRRRQPDSHLERILAGLVLRMLPPARTSVRFDLVVDPTANSLFNDPDA